MNRITTLFLFVLISQCSYGQQDAGAYMSVIGEQFQKISHDMMVYTSAVNHGKGARKVEKRRTELMQQIKESETTVRKMRAFNSSTTLRDSVVAFFKLSTHMLNQDYAKIVNMEDIAEQSYDAMEAYLLAKEKAGDKMDLASDNANAVYEAFAANNNIRLVKSEDELSRKLEKSGKVSQYSDKVYLLFFKSYKNEAYLMDAMNRNDITAIEQSRNALSASSTEDIAKATLLEAFSGDASLKAALQQALIFYKTEADDKIKSHTEFLVAKDNFEKIRKSVESVPAAKRTKENIDNYNKAVNDFNAGVNASNAMHQELNKKRSAMLKNWNETYDDFLDKHTPKYK